MARARLTGHRLRSGTYTSGNITSAYAVTAWTVQTDQKTAAGDTVIPWVAPVQPLPPARQRYIEPLDQTQQSEGFLVWEWVFSYWTFNMYSYFLTTYLATSNEYGLVSALAYDPTDTAIYLNATVRKPRIGEDMEPAPGGWRNIKLRFSRGSITA